ncbi:MAG: FtsX-like permease family protein [Thermoplasmatota archaeon]
MEMIPGWVLVASLIAPILLFLLLLLTGLLRPRKGSAFLTGIRFAFRYPPQSIARGIPVALLCAVLIGSLSVGDGLMEMVEQNTERNLSRVDLTVEAPSFMDQRMIRDLEGVPASPVIHLEASVSTEGGAALGSVSLIGAEQDAFELLPLHLLEGDARTPDRHSAFINEEVSRELEVSAGDRVLVEVTPFRRSETNLLGSVRSNEVRMDITITGIMKNSGIGRYREDAKDSVPPTMLMDLGHLQERLDREGEVNKVLVGGMEKEKLRDLLDRRADMESAGMVLREGSASNAYFLHSEDIFYNGSAVSDLSGGRTLSYFVDSISAGPSEVPYSVITGIDEEGADILGDGFLDKPPKKGEIALSNRTAERLGADIGSTIELYFRILDDLGRPKQRMMNLTLSSIYELKGIMLETGFLPTIAGLTDSPTCGDWGPGFEMDLDRVQKEDEEYWELYGTAPKGYISLEDAREIWSNPYGDTTAMIFEENASQRIDESIEASELGISLVDVRENALASSSALLIFPAMFVTFGSIMIIGAFLILHAVLKDLSRTRTHEWGILRSIGMDRKGIYSSAIGESSFSVLAGAVMGIPLGALLAYLMNLGLRSSWSRSVEEASIPFHISAGTFVVSASAALLASMVLVLLSTWAGTRGVVAVNIREKDPSISFAGKRRKVLWYVLGAAGIVFGLILLLSGRYVERSMVPASFTMGSILFSVGLSLLVYSLSARTVRMGHTSLMVSANLSRRPGKHPLAIALLVMGLTLALSLSTTAGILESGAEERIDDYGGGFQYLVETTDPYQGDVEDMEHVVMVSVGSEGGTCSNLNAVYPPRLLGVPEKLMKEPGFQLSSSLDGLDSDGEAWNALSEKMDGSVPVLVDQNTLQWIYYRSLGDTFEMEDEGGEKVELLVIGVLEPSVLTGSFVMSGEHLRELFPSRARADYILVGEGELEIDRVSEAFSELTPEVTAVRELAMENIESELSYLYLFRDFLVLGLLVSMASAAVFTHVRALSLRKEIEVMRRIGATGRRTIGYFLTENMVVFLIAAAASAGGSVISTLLFRGELGGGRLSAEILLPGAVIVALFLLVSAATASFSSIWALRSWRSKRNRAPLL